MILNNIDNYRYDKYEKKVRAILIDEDNYIYVTHMNTSITFPGGTVENSENIEESIAREIKEEVGITNLKFKYLGSLIFYHEKFPNLKEKPISFSTRVNEIHYFYSKINSKDIGVQDLTDFERESKLKIEKHKLSDLINKLNEENNDLYAKFMKEETLAAIDLYQSIDL